MAPTKKISGHIFTYSRKARDIISSISGKYLRDFGIDGISINLFTCVDELIKNAVKANYKFILIYEAIYEKLRECYPDRPVAEIEEEIAGILKVQDSYDHIARDILSERNISSEVREILDQESKLLNIKNRAYAEKREITPAEREVFPSLEKLGGIKEAVKKHNVKIILKMEANTDFFYIEVTNTAPILTHDLNRIYEKRDSYRLCRAEGREMEFFINHLDTSESGFGLGYATIDSILFNWGLNPERSLNIISSIDTTIMLTIPIEEIKRESTKVK
jgi:hypothetical protein